MTLIRFVFFALLCCLIIVVVFAFFFALFCLCFFIVSLLLPYLRTLIQKQAGRKCRPTPMDPQADFVCVSTCSTQVNFYHDFSFIFAMLALGFRFTELSWNHGPHK